MMNHKLFCLAGALLALSSSALASVTLHQWSFNDPAGTLITATAASTGTVGGVSFTNPSGSLTTGGGWRTDGGGALAIQTVSAGTVLQALAAMGSGTNNGTNGIRFEWDMALNFSGANTTGLTRDIYLINRDAGGGSNAFRFSIEMPNNSSTPTLWAEGNLKARGTSLAALGLTDSVVLRVDYFFNAGNTTVTGLEWAYSVNGGSFVSSGLVTAPANSLTNMGDLRPHAKGDYSSTDYFAINGITVSAVPEPAAIAALLGLAALGCVAWRRRR